MGRTIVCVLTLSFLFQSLPPASAASFDAQVRSAQYQNLTAEIFSVAETVRPGETLSEVYWRMERHMSAEEKSDLAPFLAESALLEAPSMHVVGSALVLKYASAPELRLETDMRDDQVYVRLNGHEARVTEEWVDPSERAKKFGALIDRAFADGAQASIWKTVFFGTSAWAASTATTGGSSLMDQLKARFEKYMVVLTPHIVKLFNSIKTKSPLCAISKKANSKGFCCVVNSNYVTNSTACCHEVGGVLDSSKPFEACSGTTTTSPTTTSPITTAPAVSSDFGGIKKPTGQK